MKRIFKYPLRLSELDNETFIVTVPMPQYAKVLSVGNQSGQIMAWALVDTTANVRDVEFKIIGTGWTLPEGEFDGWTFLGTVVVDEFVWHVWVAR